MENTDFTNWQEVVVWLRDNGYKMLARHMEKNARHWDIDACRYSQFAIVDTMRLANSEDGRHYEAKKLTQAVKEKIL